MKESECPSKILNGFINETCIHSYSFLMITGASTEESSRNTSVAVSSSSAVVWTVVAVVFGVFVVFVVVLCYICKRRRALGQNQSFSDTEPP